MDTHTQHKTHTSLYGAGRPIDRSRCRSFGCRTCCAGLWQRKTMAAAAAESPTSCQQQQSAGTARRWLLCGFSLSQSQRTHKTLSFTCDSTNTRSTSRNQTNIAHSIYSTQLFTFICGPALGWKTYVESNRRCGWIISVYSLENCKYSTTAPAVVKVYASDEFGGVRIGNDLENTRFRLVADQLRIIVDDVNDVVELCVCRVDGNRSLEMFTTKTCYRACEE